MKTKLMENSASDIQKAIKVKEQKLGTVTNVGAVVSHDGSKQKVHSRIEQATAALTMPKPIWRENICFKSKMKLMRCLVISLFYTLVRHGP